MAQDSETKATIRHLEATLAHGKLANAQVERGQALLDRLTSPIRVTLFGLPQAGKSQLLNLILGQTVVPDSKEVPTTELAYGENAECRVVKGDGSVEALPWPVNAGFDWSDVVLAKLAMPLDILKKVSFLEIVTEGSAEDLSSALNWAIPRTDISIWCTQGYVRLESALWEQVPDSLKDHGYLVITRADELSSAGILPDTIGRLAKESADDFRVMFAVATKTALAAMDGNGVVDASTRNSSGAGAFLDDLHGHIDRGNQANLDGALLFLSRYGVSEIPEEAPEKPAETSSAEPVSVAQDTEIAVENSTAAFKGALQVIAGSSEVMAKIPSDDPDLADNVLTECVAASEKIIEIFADHGVRDSRLFEEIEEANELLILMQLEHGDGSAADAATVLLQISRELETAMAA